MRIWSIHPKYLDAKGLSGLWREALLALRVLEGKTNGYKNHPQLLRFKKHTNPVSAMYVYLSEVLKEAQKRGYHFNASKIVSQQRISKIPVTSGQLLHEMEHLRKKLQQRDREKLTTLDSKKIAVHPLFKKIAGRVEQWEKVTDNLQSFPYDLDFTTVNFRTSPELYRVGTGEQGVLMVEPYKSEILPYWKFKTPEIAKKSASKILQLFTSYKKQKDFIGMDMARKFLQMGYTRSRRYANHRSGKKYDIEGNITPQEKDWDTNEKAQSAKVFYAYYLRAKEDAVYQKMKSNWKKIHG